nr:NAD(P)-dependent oxidoreductase [Pseudohalocynthiibacter aestuariivivens]
MAILLTGATGFVGRHILAQLQRRGHGVTIVARPGWQERIAFEPELTQAVETDDVFAQDADWWRGVLAEGDLVIHAAWYAEPGAYLTSGKNLDCLSGTLALAKGATAAGVGRVVGLGTCIEYEMAEHPLSSDAPLTPTTPYAAAKLSAFHTLQQWFGQEGVSFLWCRLFHLYGPGEHAKRLVPFLHDRLKAGAAVELTSGTQIRDFIDVETAARRIVDGALSDVQGAANICTGQGRTVRALAEEIADQYGRRDLLRFGARADNLVDPPCIVGVPTAFGAD